MEEETIIKQKGILNLARTVETIWSEVMADIALGTLDIRRVWDMNNTLVRLLKECQEVLDDEKSS